MMAESSSSVLMILSRKSANSKIIMKMLVRYVIRFVLFHEQRLLHQY